MRFVTVYGRFRFTTELNIIGQTKLMAVKFLYSFGLIEHHKSRGMAVENIVHRV